MNIKDRLKTAIGVMNGKIDPVSVIKSEINPVVASSIGVGDNSRGKLQTGDYQAMVKSYSSWVYAAAGVIARSVARVPLRLYKKKAVKGSPKLSKQIKELVKDKTYEGNLVKYWVSKGYEVEEINEHPYLELIKAVNPMMNGFELWELTSLYLDIIGNCYWYLRPNGAGLPAEIWVLQGQYVKVVPSAEKLVAGYIYQPKQTVIKLAYEEVIQYKYPNLSDLYYGFSPMQAGAHSIDSDRYQKEFEINLFKNGAMPGTVLQTDKKLGDDAYKRLMSFWKKFKKGGAGNTAVLESGLKANKIGLDPQELSYIDGRKETAKEILCIYGVSLMQLGFGEMTNRATADALDYVYNKSTVQPKLIRIQEKQNERIMPKYDDNLFVQFDNPIPKDKDFEIKERETNLKNYVTSINEERQNIGLDTVDWGDKPWMPFNLQQAGSSASEPIEEGKSVESRDDTYFKMWMSKEENVEKHFIRKLKVYFNEERKEVLSNLDDYANSKIISRSVIKDAVQNILFDMDEEGVKLTKLSRPELTMALKEGAVLAVAEAGLTVSPELIATQNAKWIEARLKKYVKEVNEETAKKLAKTLKEGIDAGESITKLSDRINEYYDSNEKYRSLRIARTETAESMEEGIMKAYKEGGITKVRWLVEPGACDDCAALDGEIVGIGDSFGDDAFGNLTQHPPLHCNCVCSIIAEMD